MEGMSSYAGSDGSAVMARPGQVSGPFAVGSAPEAQWRGGGGGGGHGGGGRGGWVRPGCPPVDEPQEALFDIEVDLVMESHAAAASQFGPTGKRRTVVCKHWLRGLCKKGCARRSPPLWLPQPPRRSR